MVYTLYKHMVLISLMSPVRTQYTKFVIFVFSFRGEAFKGVVASLIEGNVKID